MTSPLRHIQGFSLVVGMALGAALGLGLFCYLVPGGTQSIAMYNHKMSLVKAERNQQEMTKTLVGVDLNQGESSMMNHQMTGTNPYTMVPVTGEKQFLREMVLHHEAAVTMAQQVLQVKGIHPEVTKLAHDIVSAQSTEIKMMKDWLAAWK